MEITFKGTRYEPTPEILTQVEQQLGSVEKLIDESKSTALALVELSEAVGNQRKGDIWRAEVTIDHAGMQFRAESVKAKLDHAVTTVVRDIAQQIRRTNTKSEHLLKRGGAAVKSFMRGLGR